MIDCHFELLFGILILVVSVKVAARVSSAYITITLIPTVVVVILLIVIELASIVEIPSVLISKSIVIIETIVGIVPFVLEFLVSFALEIITIITSKVIVLITAMSIGSIIVRIMIIVEVIPVVILILI